MVDSWSENSVPMEFRRLICRQWQAILPSWCCSVIAFGPSNPYQGEWRGKYPSQRRRDCQAKSKKQRRNAKANSSYSLVRSTVEIPGHTQRDVVIVEYNMAEP